MSPATYRVPPDVAWTMDGPAEQASETDEQASVVLARMPDGEPVVLAGSAAQIWILALESPDAETVVAEISHLDGVDPADVAGPVRGLLSDLTQRSLLIPPPPPTP